ncbi:sensor histidine kinase [Streptomyces sp. 4N124]|uniref:sensor histidine kinase n=1 Tax=Streptomyces sp. 4N124 TaxID=3457420 RepID=UPI003FD5E265
MSSPAPTARPVEPGSLMLDSEHHMIARLLPWLASVERADEAHPRVRRWGVPALCALVGLPAVLEAAAGSGPGVWVALALVSSFSVPLVWRERRPMTVFAAGSVLSVADIALGLRAGSNAGRLVALYNVARRGTPVQIATALAVNLPETVATGFVLAADGPSPYLIRLPAIVIVLVACTVAFAALGLAGWLVRGYITALEERAVRLEVERDQRARLAAAGERARIAREMHDILGHTLAESGRGALGELTRLLAVDVDVDDDDVERDASGTDDSTPLAPQPGLSDLDALLERVRAAGPSVSLHTDGDVDRLGQGLQLAIYRIVQEALTNTLKHAAPDTSVTVAVAADGDLVRVAVEDTGPPHSRRAGRRSGGGHGLVGMRERAALYQGRLDAGPNSRGGWTVRALLTATPPNTASAKTTEEHPS